MRPTLQKIGQLCEEIRDRQMQIDGLIASHPKLAAEIPTVLEATAPGIASVTDTPQIDVDALRESLVSEVLAKLDLATIAASDEVSAAATFAVKDAENVIRDLVDNRLEERLTKVRSKWGKGYVDLLSFDGVQED